MSFFQTQKEKKVCVSQTQKKVADVLHEQSSRFGAAVASAFDEEKKYRFNKGVILRWKHFETIVEQPPTQDGRKKSIAMAVDSWLQ